MQVAVFFDLDGVIADLVRGSLAVHGKAISYDDVPWELWDCVGLTYEQFWSPLGYSFWRNLPVLSHGLSMLIKAVEVVGVDNVGILTATCDTAGCIDGKLDWVKAHIPFMNRRVLVGNPKHLCAGPGKLLIDDYFHNVEGWRNAGGQAILYPQPWNTNKGLSIDTVAFGRYLELYQSDSVYTAQEIFNRPA